MKILLFSILLFPLTLLSQDVYYISHISGKVKKAAADSNLFVGKKLLSTDMLKFPEESDFVAVISPVAGSRILKREKVPAGKPPGAFVMAVNELLVPSVNINTMATRSGTINNLYDLENYLNTFSVSNPLFIVGTRKIPLNVLGFLNRDKQFVFARYKYHGEVINKKLSFAEPVSKKDSLYLVMDKNIFTIDGKETNLSSIDMAEIFYYYTAENKSTLLSSVKINYCSETDLLAELAVVKKNLQAFYSGNPDKKDLIEKGMRMHIAVNWGSLDGLQLQLLLKKIAD